MTIPIAGTTTQIGDGRVGEVKAGVMGAPTAISGATTLTAAQLLGGVITAASGTSAVNITLPTVAALETALGGSANLKTNQSFDVTIINTGTTSGVATIVAGTGWTLVGMVTLPITTSAGSSGTFRARKTGTGAWTLYRIS